MGISEKTFKRQLSDKEKSRKYINLELDIVSNIDCNEYPYQYPGEDHSFNLQKFTQNVSVRIIKKSSVSIEFDLIGVDASFANALRRILISEVPTMAINTVSILENTSCVDDETLVHRLCLVPFRADPIQFYYVENETNTENMIMMKLKAECPKVPGAEPIKIYSKDIKLFDLNEEISHSEPVHDDVLLAILTPGESIDCNLYLTKGIGMDHAKWSPVATASYRMFPIVDLSPDLFFENKDKIYRFFKFFPPNFYRIEDNIDENGDVFYIPIQNDEREHFLNRDIFSDVEFKDYVKFHRVRDHFIFNVESTGAIPPDQLVQQALFILGEKCSLANFSINKLKQVS